METPVVVAKGGANPLRIGLESARANFVPMLVLWALAAATVVGYYSSPAFAAVLEPLAAWQRDNGPMAAFISLAFFCGVVPGAFICAIRSLRPRRALATIAAMSVWCGLWGVVNNEMYTWLGAWIGSGVDFVTLLLKTLFDQFVWTVLLVAPANAAFYFWLGRDFSARRVRAEWPERYFWKVFMPNLLASWIVWIPVLFVVYAFPLPLQIQLAGLASSFWTLMCLQIGKHSAACGSRGV